MKNLILSACLLISASAWSQGTGELQFQVDVDNGYFEIVIDDTMYLKLYKATLPVGPHSAKVWSPGYITTEIDFEIQEDQTTQRYIKMAVSNERQQYERDYKEYRMQFHKHLTVPGTSTLALALVSGGFMISGYNLRKKITSDVDLYHKSPTYQDVVLYKDRIALNNKKYNRQRVVFYTTLGLTAAALGTTIYTYSKFKRNYKEPKLNSVSPFKDKFSWAVTPFGCYFKWSLG